MNRRTTLALTALTAPALALALAASSSSASAPGAPSDTSSDTSSDTPTDAVTLAVTSSPLTSAVPAGSFTVTDVRVAGEWAAAVLEPTDPAALDPATAVLRFDATSGWSVVDLGTAGVGCDAAPVTAREPLALGC